MSLKEDLYILQSHIFLLYLSERKDSLPRNVYVAQYYNVRHLIKI